MLPPIPPSPPGAASPLASPGPRPTPAVSLTGLSGGASRGGVALSIPLPFLLAGAAAAALFGLLAPFVLPEALRAPGFPHVLALVHLATLGWLTMTVMGASLQLAPVILVTQLRAARFVRWQFPVYALGVVVLLCGFAEMRPALLAVGGALVALAVAHHIVVLTATLAGATTRPLTARYLAAAQGYLALVVSLGLTAALNKSLHFLGTAAGALLLAHITIGLVGWLSCTLIGVSYTLVRMFALAHGHDDRLGRAVFVLLNAGALGLAVGFGFRWMPLTVAGGLSLTAAAWLFAYDYARMLRARRRKLLDVTQRHGIAAVAYLAVVIPLGLVAALTGTARPPILAALGVAALVGWLGQSIIGYLYKIVPFLVWHTRYGPLVGQRKVPLMRDLVHERWAKASWWLINLGLPVTALAAALSWVWPAQIASATVGAGLALAAANVAGVLARR